MNVSIAVVATMTRGTVIRGEGSGLWLAGVEDMRRKESIKILLWHLYAGESTRRVIQRRNKFRSIFGDD
jgi:hypothetical protein